MSDLREQVGEAMYKQLGPVHHEMGFPSTGDFTYAEFAESNGMVTDENSYTIEYQMLAKMADAAIAAHSEYLWAMADDPEVVEAVAMVTTDMLRETGRIDLVGCIVTATLETLLGPRPSGEEAEHG